MNKKGGAVKMDGNKLEDLREELYESINKCICLCNENVIEISERLDKLIIEEYEG
ncbi:MAG: NTP pyrophosphatase (non-canonical NTP hydrolase) [Clostridium sp.]